MVKKDLKDLVIETWPNKSFKDLDRVLALTSDDFRELYLGLMKGHCHPRGNKKPVCSRCRNPIAALRDFRRYFENDMHAACFKALYRQDISRDGTAGKSQKYWKKVYRL